jgi:hypothetical protein
MPLKELSHLTARKYQAARRREKTDIMDTFVAQTGYGPKYAIPMLANEGVVNRTGKRVRLKTAAKAGVLHNLR